MPVASPPGTTNSYQKIMAPVSREEEEESGSEESDNEEDPRVTKLVLFQDKHTPEETAAHVRELGGEDAIIYGDLYVGKEREAMAWFLLMGGACLDEEKPLAPQVEERLPLFKAFFTAEDLEQQAALLVMFELYCRKERQAGLKEAGDLLKVLWENDIVAEEVLEAWHANEQALRELVPKHWDQEDAILIRESSRKFIEWMQAGEDGY